MTQLLPQLRAFGLKAAGKPDAKAVLMHLTTAKKLSPREIAEMFGVTPEAVRHHLREMGLMLPQLTFAAAIRVQGYKDRDDFFEKTKLPKKTDRELARMLGLKSPGTIAYEREQCLQARMLKASKS